ncbi:hypothetical protein NC653_030078 [Populus alba x Populus x berolinensis]|uniref:Agenet domain-containing protein n=1 Tax=Populus alba x Populus x berolinensis TaxID=444605 RepID=A0AAD6PZW5_9ROSI|nr:hypothetical protein NC653_030078 [Populus alba x Populus x berolinensis]
MAPKSKSNQDPYFKPGSKVEIMSDEAGFRGSFYIGTVMKATRTPEFTVRYEKLFEDEEGTKPLQETVNEFQIRPIAPREKKREFKFSEEVDAFHNDGWWEGVITEVNENGKFAVFFRSTKEQIEFVEEDLRLHREWVNGEWKPPLEGEEEKGEKEEVEEKGNKGSRKKKKLSEEDEKEVTKEVKRRVSEDFFDLIDIDSFGSDISLFLRSAMNTLSFDGLLYVTSTDGHSSGGHHPDHSLAAFGAYVRPMPYSNEVGLRMLIGGAVREASVLGYYITPLFSYYSYHGPVFRVMLRVNRGKLLENRHYGFITYCNNCGNSQEFSWAELGQISCSCSGSHGSRSLVISGPLWTGPLHSAAYIIK